MSKARRFRQLERDLMWGTLALSWGLVFVAWVAL
jgi:hypothetical protein